jgi:hypothetical protein
MKHPIFLCRAALDGEKARPLAACDGPAPMPRGIIMDETALRAANRQLARWHHRGGIRAGSSTWEAEAEGRYDEEPGSPIRLEVAAHFPPLLQRLFPQRLFTVLVAMTCPRGGSFERRQ